MYQSIKPGNGNTTLLNGIRENNSSWPGFVIRRNASSGTGYKNGVYLYAKWQFDNSTVSDGKYYANNLGGGFGGTDRTTNG
jgi:hypothetical protein